MDAFDTPTLIPERPKKNPKKPPGPSVTERMTRAGETVGRGLDLAGSAFAGPAQHWHDAATKRLGARTEDARKALLEANRNRRDAMRDLRRDRKAFEKARDEVSWWNIFNGERRAARAVVRDTRQLAAEARSVRREAAKAYPLTLPQLAARCHAAHMSATGLWWLLSDSIASDVAAGTSVAAIAFNVATVWLGGRHVSQDTVDAALEALSPSQEERDLLQRLDPKVWHGVAEPRGLADVVAGGATLTNSGIQVKLTLNGSMDLATLQKKEAQLRAALRLREGTRMELREGKTGGHARLTLRTRSRADGLDLTGWKPGDAWAVNTITGETVPVPLGKRLLFAGTSGAGKSWSARPLMAEASEHEDHRLVIFDRKHIEAVNWQHRARTATELDEMRDLCAELIAEGEDRLKLIPRGEDVVSISPSRPRITVFVDEGGELISDSKTKYPKDENGLSDYQDIMTSMRTIARKYRAAEIILVWCTQKPALSGDGHGLDSQIAGQLVHRLSLALATTTDAQVVFGNDAIEKGWKANELPMPGFALFRNQELGPKSIPQMMKMRAMSPKDVIALPPRPIWHRSTGRASAADVAARKAIEADAQALAATTVVDPWAGTDVDTDTVPLLDPPKARVSAEDRDDQIIRILEDDPCQTLSELARLTGASKSVVKRRLDQMEVDGLVVRDEDNCWHPVR
ncbi:FtsK-like DNA translocase [Streptomyces phage YDN12]|uniref:FtsK-like DNA translocase n=1 Tax=Streptomyces phage YDN12 TaxID=1636183 RepID=A0A0E3JJF8_9CAUD|nr:FtsK/SpoIIIE-like protein [Streptomyces phage YDN12]AKA61738.1 FtsK-like DNA translocase [Streptomyces phage YDN12]